MTLICEVELEEKDMRYHDFVILKELYRLLKYYNWQYLSRAISSRYWILKLKEIGSEQSLKRD